MRDIGTEIVVFFPERHHMAEFPGPGEKAVVFLYSDKGM